MMRAVAIAFSAAIAASAAHAQSVTSGPPLIDSIPRRAVQNLRPQSRIRLVVRAGKRIIADSPYANGDTLVATINGKQMRIALADIDTLWVKRGTVAGLGAAITGIPSAIFGALFGAFLATDRDSNGHPGNGPRGAVVAGTIVGLLGAIPGAVIGGSLTRWTRLYARTPR